MEIKPGSKSHPYMPTSVPATRDEMLETLGLEKLEDLIKVIPEALIYKGHLDIPGPLNAEADLKQHVDGILDKNISCSNYLSFLGAGCYRHYVPAVCDEINSRSEFLTAYVGDTYSDHGKFQAFFEFCSMMAELLDMDVVSYPTFDGGQAVCSALRMAMRITGKRELLLPRTMNPEILSQAVDYCGKDAVIKLVNYDSETGQLDIEDLERNATDQTAAVFFENPSYLGFLEEKGREIINIAHKKNALSIVYTDPISLGILEPPSSYGADLVCGDIQPLGIHMHFGGGCAGFIASRDEERIINEYPTYLIGLAETKNGRGFGWGRALNWRTSHGSREKGKEYMGTAAGLWAITAAVYLALMGPQGMKEIGETIISRTYYAKEFLASIGGINTTSFKSLSFKEFPVNFDSTGLSVKEINTRLLEYEIFGGKDLSSEFPELGQTALYCITEMITETDIKKLAEALKSIVTRNRGKA
ncbi:MAG: aminomethyl-transferring glycine dehydrogenase subunit GcvPA [Bacillota bacterium]|nr:aminomethyl-transferring glycine dehydrogenase subunit GcvPA [Bacillota bacterium]